MIKSLLTDVYERLETVPCAYLALDCGQLELGELDREDYPCLLVDVTEADYGDSGKRMQSGQLTLTVKVADLGEADDMGLYTVYEVMEQVFEALHGFAPEYCAPLGRRRLEKSKREDGIRQWAMSFSTVVYEYVPEPSLTTVSAELDLRRI